MNRSQISERIHEIGVVPVIRAPSADAAARAIEAIYAGGIGVIEITMSVPGAVELIAKIVAQVGKQVLVGAGTVLDAKTARTCLDAGADFIVSPGFSLATLEAAHAQDKPAFPGALTPTEVISAWQSGADAVKVFPCGALGGAKYLKALRAPLPDIPLMPTGGVSLENARDYLEAGAFAVGLGSDLVDLAAISAGRAGEVTRRARELVEIVRRARAALSSG